MYVNISSHIPAKHISTSQSHIPAKRVSTSQVISQPNLCQHLQVISQPNVCQHLKSYPSQMCVNISESYLSYVNMSSHIPAKPLSTSPSHIYPAKHVSPFQSDIPTKSMSTSPSNTSARSTPTSQNPQLNKVLWIISGIQKFPVSVKFCDNRF